MTEGKLPVTPRDVFKLRPKEWVIYNGLIALFRISGLWKYPIRANGDLERMRLLDKVYWLYKTKYPMRKARRGSGLESFFESQKTHRWELPAEFEPASEMSISAVGDLINHAYLSNSAETLYQDVEDILFDVDLSMANLECVILPKREGSLEFSSSAGPPLAYDVEDFDVVKGYGGKSFTFMATACNHSLDFGLKGVRSTIDLLKDAGIAFNGVNETELDANRATIVERNGIRVGVIAYTFGLNAYRPPEDRPRLVNVTDLNRGVAAADLTQFKAQLGYCQEMKVDFVMAHLHWGLEHEFYPIPEQVELAHELAELGVDGIIGHHPHVVQPVEYYRTRRDPLRVVPIFYSLGNLVNGFSAPYLCESGVARLVLAKGAVRGSESPQTYVKTSELLRVKQVVDERAKTVRIIRVEG